MTKDRANQREEWEAAPLWTVCKGKISNGLGESGQDGEPGWVRYLRTTDIDSLFTLSTSKHAALPPEIAERAMLRKGDILMTNAGSLGTTYLYDGDEPACFAGFLTRFHPDERFLDARYAAYWTQSRHFLDQVEFGAVTMTISNFSAGKTKRLRVLLPPFETQKRIAEFLDAETAKIDALVTELTGFAELLKARDKSLIAECVTQGVPHRRAGRAMKDSGVDWIGQVPEGWQITKLGRLFRLIRGVSYSASDLGERGEPGVVKMINLKSISKDATYRAEGAKWFKGEHHERHLCGSGDILIATTDLTGDRHIVGRPILVPEDLGDVVYSMDLSKVTDLRPECDARFLYFALNAETARNYAKQISPGTTVKHLDMQRFPLYPMALPPIGEQQEIATYLEEELAKSRELQGELENQVHLLKSYRKSLISEVVTGKIEV